jgi:hypothetical protein
MQIVRAVLNCFIKSLTDLLGKNYEDILYELEKSAYEIPYKNELFFFPHLKQRLILLYIRKFIYINQERI